MNGWIYLLPIRRSFSKREGHDFIVTFKVQILVFILTAPEPLVFARQTIHVIPIALLLVFWVATLLHQSASPRLTGNGRKRKSLSLSNCCGMGDAVDVEVIRDDVGEFALGEEDTAGCERNELAAAQFNRSEVLGLLDCSF